MAISITGSGIGRTITNIGVTSVLGTANQILVNSTVGSGITGAVTLSLPQGIGTTSSVNFSSLYLSSAGIGFSTAGSVNIGTSLTVGTNLLVANNITIGNTINTSTPLVVGTTDSNQLSGFFTGFIAAQKFVDQSGGYDKYFLDPAYSGDASSSSISRTSRFYPF